MNKKKHFKSALCCLALASAPFYSAAAQAASGQAAYVDAAGNYSCLSVNDSNQVVGAQCDDRASTWTTRTDGRVGLDGTNMCMDVDTAHPSNGNKVQVYDCTGVSVNQLFTWSGNGDGTIKLNSNGLCVAPPANGSQATVAGCNDSNAFLLSKRVVVTPNWPNDIASVPVYFQASATSGYQQKLTIFGPQIATPLSATSNTSEPFGTQFLLSLQHLAYAPGDTYTFNIFVERSNSAGAFQRSPVLIVNQTIPVTNPDGNEAGQVIYVGANDTPPGIGDQDFNDTMVLISLWNQSTD